LFAGKIDQNEQEAIKVKMIKWLNHPDVQSWFDGSYQILSEVAILHKSIRRPDRVMIGTNEAIVLDYKFGKADASKHQAQVQGYMNMIKEMGYRTIKGYIWYVPHGEVVRVNNQMVQGKLF
jgi:ATP-dependent helicase/nuclease subunit A